MGKKAETRKSFDDLAWRYDEWFSTEEGRYVDLYERRALLGFVKPSSADVLLDVGTGTGTYLLEAARHGAYVVGLDISREMLKVLAGKISREGVESRVELVLGDAEHLPFREGAFTKLVCNTVIEFTPKPDDAVSEFSRVLGKDGEVFIGVLTSTSVWAFRRWLKNLSGRNVYAGARFYTLGKLRSLLTRGKLVAIDCRWAVFAPPGCPSGLLPLFEGVERSLCHRRILGGFGAFLAVKAVRA